MVPGGLVDRLSAGGDQVMGFLRAEYDRVSPDGPDHFPEVYAKTLRMLATEPELDLASLAAVEAPTLVLQGDRDEVILGHGAAVAAALPHGRLAGAQHPRPAVENRCGERAAAVVPRRSHTAVGWPILNPPLTRGFRYAAAERRDGGWAAMPWRPAGRGHQRVAAPDHTPICTVRRNRRGRDPPGGGSSSGT